MPPIMQALALVYKELRDEAGDNISGTSVASPILLHVLRDEKIRLKPRIHVINYINSST